MDKATSGGVPFTEREHGKLLWVVAQPGDAIIWHKMDRAFRSVRDGANTLHLFKAKRISIHSIDIGLDTGSALGEFVCHLMMLLGELERSWVSIRTKEAVLAKMAKGEACLKAPPGYKTHGRKGERYLVPDKAERKVIEDAYADFDTTDSIETVSRRLATSGFTRANGGKASPKWLLYAFYAMRLGWPTNYHYAFHRMLIATMKAMPITGNRRQRHLTYLRMLGGSKAALQRDGVICPDVLSSASALFDDPVLPSAPTP